MIDNVSTILIIIAVVMVLGIIWYLLDIPIGSHVDLPPDSERSNRRKG